MAARTGLPLGQAFLNGILVRTAERRENQLAGIRLPRRHRQARAALINLADLPQIGEVEIRMNAEHVEVQGHRDHIQIARALAVAEESSLHPVRAGQESQFGGGHTRGAIVVGVQADNEAVPVADVAAHPFNLIGVHIRSRYLHRAGQVQDHLPLRCGLPHGHHRFGNLQRELEFGGAEAFRRILQPDIRALQPVQALLDPTRSLDRDGLNLFAAFPEHHPALSRRRGIVQVDDHPFGTHQRLDGPLDQIFPGLDQHLDGHVFRNPIFLDEPPIEGELGVRCRWESDLDLLEAAVHQRLEELELLGHIHGHRQRLIAVAKVDTAPDGRRAQRARRPLTVAQVHRRSGAILRGWILQHIRNGGQDTMPGPVAAGKKVPVDFTECRLRKPNERPESLRTPNTKKPRSQIDGNTDLGRTLLRLGGDLLEQLEGLEKILRSFKLVALPCQGHPLNLHTTLRFQGGFQFQRWCLR